MADSLSQKQAKASLRKPAAAVTTSEGKMGQ